MKYQNHLDGVRDIINMGSIVPVWPKTITVTDYVIGKTRDDLIRNLVQFRRELIDPRWRRIFWETFPIGQCEYIRDVVYEILKVSPRAVCPEFPDISPFSIPLRKIWCIQGDRYMNNALQYGNWIIDAANDTADMSKYPVTVLKIKDSNMRNPRDHVDICTVLEKYWSVKCFPNVYYPDIAPFFPVIFASEDKVWFASRSLIDVDAKWAFDGCSSAYDFIYRSPFSIRRLSNEKFAQLMKKNTSVLKTDWPARRQTLEKSFSQKRKLGPNVLAKQYLEQYSLLEKEWFLLSGGI